MKPALRALLAAAFLTVSASAVLASASNTPTMYQPDPALKTESVSQLQARIRQACGVTQAKLQGVSETSLSRKCDCYAGRTLRTMSADEVQAYRDTGVFNDTARGKALAALESCKLQRPAL
ncbi:hypothetical protein [Microvirga antarctica]|uniref:hypothetical protein n=1 Tax=Microvirga antarctica TaxID=2819233 RepID=UPI001B304FCE|nr:hypothetical protein [Microvirga antarctica]